MAVGLSRLPYEREEVGRMDKKFLFKNSFGEVGIYRGIILIFY